MKRRATCLIYVSSAFDRLDSLKEQRVVPIGNTGMLPISNIRVK